MTLHAKRIARNRAGRPGLIQWGAPVRAPRYAHDDVDLRRRYVAHDQWIADHPVIVSFVETWAVQNLEMIGGL